MALWVLNTENCNHGARLGASFNIVLHTVERDRGWMGISDLDMEKSERTHGQETWEEERWPIIKKKRMMQLSGLISEKAVRKIERVLCIKMWLSEQFSFMQMTVEHKPLNSKYFFEQLIQKKEKGKFCDHLFTFVLFFCNLYDFLFFLWITKEHKNRTYFEELFLFIQWRLLGSKIALDPLMFFVWTHFNKIIF